MVKARPVPGSRPGDIKATSVKKDESLSKSGGKIVLAPANARVEEGGLVPD